MSAEIFSENDFQQFSERGIPSETVQNQWRRFQTGFPSLVIAANVEIGHGIVEWQKKQQTKYIQIYQAKASSLKTVKFVPASGAASRMFRPLFRYLDDKGSSENDLVTLFFDNLDKFPFYQELAANLDDKDNLEKLAATRDRKLLKKLLTDEGLNYGQLPKALLPFHCTGGNTVRKAIDAHLMEGMKLCAPKVDTAHIHFTISPQHHEMFQVHLDKAIRNFQALAGKELDVTLSIQDPATDTVAVDLQNTLARDEQGKLIFRPGGHGALLKNLDRLDADLVYIKNVDNVSQDHLMVESISYKQAMAGCLLDIQRRAFEFCQSVKDEWEISRALEQEIIQFAREQLGFEIPPDFGNWDTATRRDYLFQKLNRPLRVCGVIQHQQTGGGPYWVTGADGSKSLQLVETSQINKKDAVQRAYLENSKYANITDLVCGLRDFQGKKFDLTRYSEPNTGFISEKSHQGRAIKAMELPGLWNGAMSHWNTCFVQVPETTFTPVKTVFDLLKPAHQKG